MCACEIVLIVLSSDWSPWGRVGVTGFTARVLLAAALLLVDDLLLARPRGPRLHGYLAILLVLVAIMHVVGWRLTGDSRWLYAMTRSLAFDGDLRLNDEYRALGIADDRGSQLVWETGLARTVFPVGAPLVWVAFVPAGHLGAWLRNSHGVATPYDGFSLPYPNAAALGNLVLGWLGLVVLDRLLRRWFSAGIAFAACATTLMGTFLVWYLAYQPLYAHPVTFLLVTLFLARWIGFTPSPRGYAILGLLLGAATCARWQSAVFGILVCVSLARDLTARRWRLAVLGGAAAAGGFLLAFAPQLVAWREIFGRAWVGIPQGAEFMDWRHPFLVEVLLSSRHGLFSWSPVLAFAACGLAAFAWRRRLLGLPLAAMLLVLIYVNATVADWWAGGAFGARRFESALPILAIGLAEALRLSIDLVRRRPALVVGSALAVLVGFNLLLAEQYRSGRLPYDDTVSWERVTQGMSEEAFDAVGYPFSFPANWAFALRYGRPKTQFDLLVGRYLFHMQNNLGGVIDLGEDDTAFVGDGWTSPCTWPGRRTGRLALPPRAGIFVPTHRPEPLRVELECALTSSAPPGPVEVRLNGRSLGTILPPAELGWRGVDAPAAFWRRINLLELVPADPSTREPFLAVDRVRFSRAAP